MKCYKNNGNMFITKSFEDSGPVILWFDKKIRFMSWNFNADRFDYEEIPFPKEEEKYFIINIFGCDATGRNIEFIRKCL